MEDKKDKEIRLLRKQLSAAIMEVQIYRDYAAQIRNHFRGLDYILRYAPDKDKSLHKAIWGY